MNIHETKSDIICISEHWEIVNCPNSYLIPIQHSKARKRRDISDDFVGISLHFILFSLIYEVFILVLVPLSEIRFVYQVAWL